MFLDPDEISTYPSQSTLEADKVSNQGKEKGPQL